MTYREIRPVAVLGGWVRRTRRANLERSVKYAAGGSYYRIGPMPPCNVEGVNE